MAELRLCYFKSQLMTIWRPPEMASSSFFGHWLRVRLRPPDFFGFKGKFSPRLIIRRSSISSVSSPAPHPASIKAIASTVSTYSSSTWLFMLAAADVRHFFFFCLNCSNCSDSDWWLFCCWILKVKGGLLLLSQQFALSLC